MWRWILIAPAMLAALSVARWATHADPPAVMPDAPAFAARPQAAQAVDLRGRHGPYVRIDRANEVAAYARGLGYNAEVIYLGTLDDRTYAVDVW